MSEIIKSLKESWFIYLFIGSIIVTWTQFESRISSLEKGHIETTTSITILTTQYNNVTSDISSIKTSLDFITKQLTK